MSVRVVPYANGGWEVDIRLRLPNGERHRERRVISNLSKSAATRWGQERERHLLQHGPAEPKKEVPTLEEFAPKFLDGHARANRQKPSGIAAKETILKVHLIPLLGAKRLDAITNEDVQRVKSHLKAKAPKTLHDPTCASSETVRSVLRLRGVRAARLGSGRVRSSCCPDCLARWRGRTPVGRDGRVGVDRHRLRDGTDLRSAVCVERTGRRAQGRTDTACVHDSSARESVT
jgi:hypothetical protein